MKRKLVSRCYYIVAIAGHYSPGFEKQQKPAIKLGFLSRQSQHRLNEKIVQIQNELMRKLQHYACRQIIFEKLV